MKIGIVGSGAMGAGIAQVASQCGHEVVVIDNKQEVLDKAQAKLAKVMARLIEKGRVTESDAEAIQSRIQWTLDIVNFEQCGLVVEAIVERLDIKQEIFQNLEAIVTADCILASNTSSLSVTAIASACERPERVLGVHFFNPAPLMPLVEIIPAVQTDADIVNKSKALIDDWGKVTVLAKDTPGFIVNRVARPFYGEAIRIYEEGFVPQNGVGFATIDTAMKELGGFRMGPFELMDFIGNDINYAVTTSAFEAFYYDPRYKPSFTQKRLVEAGWLGRKSGKGYYDHSENAETLVAIDDLNLKQQIFWRILVMLINEAADALYLNIASKEDIDLAMTKGVNYPKGLLKWADEFGIDYVVESMDRLHAEYLEDRYRCSPILRRMQRNSETFYTD